jgi:hypothetical protein
MNQNKRSLEDQSTEGQKEECGRSDPTRKNCLSSGLYFNNHSLFVSPLLDDLLSLRVAMELFGLAFGLFVNLDKCVATPIGCSAEELALVQDSLSCGIQGFPCRYLDIPLSIFKLKKADAMLEGQDAQRSRQDGTGHSHAISDTHPHIYSSLPISMGDQPN